MEAIAYPARQREYAAVHWNGLGGANALLTPDHNPCVAGEELFENLVVFLPAAMGEEAESPFLAQAEVVSGVNLSRRFTLACRLGLLVNRNTDAMLNVAKVLVVDHVFVEVAHMALEISLEGFAANPCFGASFLGRGQAVSDCIL